MVKTRRNRIGPADMPAALEAEVRKSHDPQPEFHLLRHFGPYLVRFSKLKISLEAENALVLLILVGQRYANEFLHTCSGRPWVGEMGYAEY